MQVLAHVLKRRGVLPTPVTLVDLAHMAGLLAQHHDSKAGAKAKQQRCVFEPCLRSNVDIWFPQEERSTDPVFTCCSACAMAVLSSTRRGSSSVQQQAEAAALGLATSRSSLLTGRFPPHHLRSSSSSSSLSPWHTRLAFLLLRLLVNPLPMCGPALALLLATAALLTSLPVALLLVVIWPLLIYHTVSSGEPKPSNLVHRNGTDSICAEGSTDGASGCRLLLARVCGSAAPPDAAAARRTARAALPLLLLQGAPPLISPPWACGRLHVGHPSAPS